ncbi:MAG: hypothetical protein ACC656_15220, partial [Candidatus Heimdallarchaeota archaeon]
MSSETTARSSKIAKLKRYLKTTALILLVLFAVAPIILAAIPNTESSQTYSIYNTGYDGFSIIREDLEAQLVGQANKYQALNIISNLNVLNRFNGSGVLVIAGPSANYDLTETISVILYLLRGGSVIIADDFGTGNQILDPLFDAFANIDKFSEEADNLGFEVPGISEIFGAEAGNTTSTPSGGSGEPLDPSQFLDGGSSAAAEEIGGNFMTELIGKVILRFAINATGVLMDAISNNESPARPIITEIDKTDLSFGNDKYTYTEGVDRIQMEFASIISVQIRRNITVVDENGDVTEVETKSWQPLQKLSTSLLTGGEGGVDIDLPFFPFYSSK